MMTSRVAWLDTSADEQRRVREMIALFTQRESRDELGIGQIRDVFSDALFPGTSVIQTRARYFLIVPWVFTQAAHKGRSGPKLAAHANDLERRLVELLRQTGATEGLIGLRVGAALKILPSTIYWSGLRTYHILIRDVDMERLGERSPQADEADELAGRVIGDWDPTLPSMPDDFLRLASGGLDMQRQEAAWLRDRIVTTAPATLLTHMLLSRNAPDPTITVPWLDANAMNAPSTVVESLRQAQFFSLVMHGAALLYNLLVAERYVSAGLTRVIQPVERYRDAYATWMDEIEASQHMLASWNSEVFWSFILTRNPRVSMATQSFVTRWVQATLAGPRALEISDLRLRKLIAERERNVKRGQSRLVNNKLLSSWAGESGAAPLTYRWFQVKRMVTDILDGLNRDASS